MFPQGESVQISIERIQELVCERFSVTHDELTDSSLPKIGKEFGGRDHTTVIHSTSKIARLIREDRSVYNLVQELTARVKQVR